MGKQLVSFITCDSELSAPFLAIAITGRPASVCRASSTNKTGRHDIAEILLKVALNKLEAQVSLYRSPDINKSS
jgi:hypothetical protein